MTTPDDAAGGDVVASPLGIAVGDGQPLDTTEETCRG
jgi:hypothetical protein